MAEAVAALSPSDVNQQLLAAWLFHCSNRKKHSACDRFLRLDIISSQEKPCAQQNVLNLKYKRTFVFSTLFINSATFS